jgi:hypothetical protein
MEVVAEQQGVNLSMALVAPTGERLLEVDAARGKDGTESLARIAETAGTYRVEVRVVGKNAAAGGYRITLRAFRSPTAQDRVLDEARRLTEESRKLKGKGAYADALAPALCAHSRDCARADDVGR